MKEITPSSHGSSSNTVISSAFYLSHQLLTAVKRLIRVCSVQPSTEETCYFTVCPSEVPKNALPGALPLISSLQECKVSECPCLRSFLAFAIQEPLTRLNDVGWLCNVDCCSLRGAEGRLWKIFWGLQVALYLKLRFLRSMVHPVYKQSTLGLEEDPDCCCNSIPKWLQITNRLKIITVKIPFTKQGLLYLLG